MMMISPKKPLKLARKWRKQAARNRKIISLYKLPSFTNTSTTKSMKAKKGHFVVYTFDMTRFELPLAYLQNGIVRELFTLAEEEFGVHSSGPLTLLCDAVFLNCLVSLIQRHVSQDLEEALIASLTCNSRSCGFNKHQELTNSHQILVRGF